MTTRRTSLLSLQNSPHQFSKNLHPRPIKKEEKGSPLKTLPISFFQKSILLWLNPIQRISFLPKLWFTNPNAERGELKMGSNRFATRHVWRMKVKISDSSYIQPTMHLGDSFVNDSICLIEVLFLFFLLLVFLHFKLYIYTQVSCYDMSQNKICPYIR
ncbi:Uncharacterized protein TCM_029751 [Theobroma cacao]|uniref:Uncharacterized protein n=1 Tax=Theobroma cacao TaxID=3641 RepID=A0A061GF64_THECC|nr:Uncharacterized protein TCM_029751 [Theobroma cacao]